MMFASFENWRAGKSADFAAQDPLLKCPKCHGLGEIYDECFECGHESEQDCETCAGQGKLHFNDISEKEWAPIFTYAAYFAELIEVSRDLSSFCGKDFFELMCDAVKVSGRASMGVRA